MITEVLEHENANTPEVQPVAEGAQASGAPEGFPDRERSGILVHDSNDSTCGNGDGMAGVDAMPAIDVFADQRGRDRIGMSKTLLNRVDSSR